MRILFFNAGWCSPCQQLKPQLEVVKQQFKDKVSFEDINVDYDAYYVQTYEISSVPTVLLENGGNVLERIVGVKPIQFYIDTINKYL